MPRYPALAAAILAVACGSAEPMAGTGDEPARMTADEFVQVMVELRQVARHGTSNAAFRADREEILARHGITAGVLVEFAERHGSDPATMAAAWDSIEVALEVAAAVADSAAAAAAAEAAADSAAPGRTPADSMQANPAAPDSGSLRPPPVPGSKPVHL